MRSAASLRNVIVGLPTAPPRPSMWRAVDLLVREEPYADALRVTSGVDDERPRADRDVLRMRVEEGELLREPMREHHVVGVEVGDERRARLAEAGIARRRHAAVRKRDDADARIASRRTRRRRGRAIGRTVVEHEELELGEIAREHAAHRLGDESLAVVDGHDDGDARCAEREMPLGGVDRGSGREGARRVHGVASPAAGVSTRVSSPESAGASDCTKRTARWLSS